MSDERSIELSTKSSSFLKARSDHARKETSSVVWCRKRVSSKPLHKNAVKFDLCHDLLIAVGNL
jgi:hypothetical protein